MVQVSDLETDLSALLTRQPRSKQCRHFISKGESQKRFPGEAESGKRHPPPPPPRSRLELRAVLIVNIHTWKVVNGPMPSQGKVDWDRRQGSRGSPISRIGESVYRARTNSVCGKSPHL